MCRRDLPSVGMVGMEFEPVAPRTDARRLLVVFGDPGDPSAISGQTTDRVVTRWRGCSTESRSCPVLPTWSAQTPIANTTKTHFEQLCALTEMMRRALADAERGLGRVKVVVDDDAFAHLVRIAAGDARSALNALELAAAATDPDAAGVYHVTLAVAEESIQRRALAYDRQGDQHYDTISAFIKSVRGSDPDAALYWMARMIYAGEDPMFIARRLIVLASEDIGNADPMGIVVATAAAGAVEQVGMPEGRIPLAQAVTYLASAPKSNASYLAVGAALKDVEDKKIGGVPLHLRNAPAKGMADLGYGRGYKYPHDFSGGQAAQEYLPPELAGVQYYRQKDIGFEKTIRDRLDARPRAGAGAGAGSGGGQTAADAEKGDITGTR